MKTNTMSELSCSFLRYCESSCDRSSRWRGHSEFYPLVACNSDIKSHLRSVKVSQTCVSSEKDLILARAGLFEHDGNGLVICPKHRAELGVMFCAKRKCLHPLHGRSKRKPDRGINLQISKEIKAKWDVVVPVGSGIVLYRSVQGLGIRMVL